VSYNTQVLICDINRDTLIKKLKYSLMVATHKLIGSINYQLEFQLAIQ